MRLVLFSLVNVSAALLFGLIAYFQGYGAGRIALHVIVVLVVLQLAYVVWLVVVSLLPSNPADATADPGPKNGSHKPGRDVVTGTADQSGGPVS